MKPPTLLTLTVYKKERLLLLISIKNLHFPVPGPFHFIITSFVSDAINDAANEAMPLKGSFKPIATRPIWWDEECSNMVKLRQEATSRYKMLSNLDNYLQYKNIEARTKLLFKHKYRESWKSFLNKLNKSTPPSEIWNFIKRINNKNYSFKKTPIPNDLIENLLDYFAPPFAANIKVRENFKNNHTGLSENPIEKAFTLQELESAIKDTPSTAPGSDSFTYKIIQNLPQSAKIILLKIYNDWWLKSSYVDQLKDIIICLILKPNKDPDLPSSYRPISLMSCLMKTFERMIKTRLEWYLENKSLLPETQYGFRRGQGTIDAITQLVTDVQCTFSNNSYLACFFLDLKGAYDSVDLNFLDVKLNNLGIKASSSITEIFKNREIHIRDHNNALHGTRIVSQGLPQGSVLSPLLFNVYTADLHCIFDDTIKCIQYADDICLYTIQNSYNACIRDLRYIVFVVKNWLIDHGFSISPRSLQ